MDFQGRGVGITQDLPLVWLNDGAGHFSALKVGDLVVAGNERLLGNPNHLIATRNGYSFIAPQVFPSSRDLRITGLLATRPYRLTGVTSNVSFPPRNETNDFNTQLDEVYRDRLKRSPSSVYVNNEGRVVWILEYLRYRLNSCGHGDATMRVFQQILGQGIQPTCS